jgi:hypothetical protein
VAFLDVGFFYRLWLCKARSTLISKLWVEGAVEFRPVFCGSLFLFPTLTEFAAHTRIAALWRG